MRHTSDITLALGYRPPYHWEKMLRFLAGRAINGVEMVAVQNSEYMRTAHFVTPDGKQVYGWVRVGHKPNRNTLAVTANAALLPVLPQVLARIRHLFDSKRRVSYPALQGVIKV
jgi:AraC family transcriptional regulator of adaptative response / DNA-3-methyladenine glycosylase II